MSPRRTTPEEAEPISSFMASGEEPLSTWKRYLLVGLLLVLGGSAVFNLFMGVIALIQREWIAAAGLLLIGGGLTLGCQFLFDYGFR